MIADLPSESAWIMLTEFRKKGFFGNYSLQDWIIAMIQLPVALNSSNFDHHTWLFRNVLQTYCAISFEDMPTLF